VVTKRKGQEVRRMMQPILSLELARAHAEHLREAGGGPRRPTRRSTRLRRRRLRVAVGTGLVSAGIRLLGVEGR
jgi:hypothetical protein